METTKQNETQQIEIEFTPELERAIIDLINKGLEAAEKEAAQK